MAKLVVGVLGLAFAIVDVLAYMLTVSGMPAGDDELRPDPQSLAWVVIRPQP